MPKKPKIEQTTRNVTTLRFDEIAVGWEYWAFLTSDSHHDSKHCERKIERKHLQMAKDRNAVIFHFGDTLDAMQGKFDPRRTLEDVRPEDAGADYYNRIVDHAVEDYAEFADNFVLFAKGNHETAVLDKANICLVSNLVKGMNEHTANGHVIYPGCYGGWVRFMFTVNGTKHCSTKMKYNHGFGGNAPVTRGAIQTNRQAVYLPDADIVINGHNHQAYAMPIARERLTNAGKVQRDLCWHIRTPGYKNEWGDGGSGYAVQKGFGPTPLGGVWLKFYYDTNVVRVNVIPEIE